jgi:hypothetical protein
MAALPVERAWPSPLTAAPILCVAIGAATPACARGFDHHAIAECGGEVAEQFMPIVHLVFSKFEDLAQQGPPRRVQAHQ